MIVSVERPAEAFRIDAAGARQFLRGAADFDLTDRILGAAGKGLGREMPRPYRRWKLRVEISQEAASRPGGVSRIMALT
jgi:hypothetical protein